MKNNYNIKVNPPELSSEQINKHQDFDALFAQFQEAAVPPVEEQPVEETPVRPIESGTKKVSSWVIKYGVGAILTLAASVVVVFMLQQTFTGTGNVIPTEQMEELLALQAPISNLEKPFEQLIVNEAEKGEVLNYHSGSKIIVPASAFVDETGAPVKGKVEIQYREFNDHVDMFLAGVPKELDKHQNLQSVGMMEIKGFQDGKPVYLNMDKTLEVELQGRAIASLPTDDLGVYAYGKQEDVWEYVAKDEVEVLAQSTSTPATDSVWDEEAIIAEVEQQLNNTKPIAPIEPGVPEHMQVFDFDIKPEEFPELAQYNQNVELMVDNNKASDDVFLPEWETMDMIGLGNNKYQLTLTRKENGETITEKFEVYPVVPVTEESEQQYKEDMRRYNARLEQWNTDVATAVAEKKASMSGGTMTTDWVDLVNRFSIHRFGLWNCGKTVDMKEELQIDASFVDENGLALAVDKLFITNQDKQLYYFTPKTNDATTASLKYDAAAQNIIWALTEENELLVAHIDDSNPSDENYTFQMKAAGVVESEDDIRNVLTF